MIQVALLAAVAALGPLQGAVKVEPIAYHGWEGSYRITNGAVELIVVPAIGRVMRYGYVNGPNMLWENAAMQGKPPTSGAWSNYGGDKVWPAPQSRFGWPPDPTIDGSPWTALTLPNGVRLTSPLGKRSQVRFVRDITLAEVGTEVRFHNLMTNQGPARPMAPWQITQVDDPYSVFLPTLPSPQMPNGWRLLTGTRLDSDAHHIETGGLRLSLGRVSFKFGAFARSGEITASKGNMVFHDQTKTYDGANYPDGGSALEVYLSAGADKYAELELLGPLTRMENNEAANLDTTWRLTQGS